MRAKWIPLLTTLFLLMTYTALPAYAEQKDDHRTELILHAGSPEILVDGLPTTIAAPYVAKDATMVPLSVFTRVLGADLSLKDNKTITLTVPSYEVVVTLGSKSATVNGKATTLIAAPAVKNGYAYVPLRLLELFDGEMTYDAVSREIVVKIAITESANSRGGFAIDSDAGKTGIGDSHYHWSMSYPAGLMQEYQSDTGDSLIFRDLKKEYYLGIFVEPEQAELTSDDRRGRLYEYVEGGETIVDKSTVEGSSYTYDRITTKDQTGFYYEMRGLQSGDFFYVVIFGKKADSITELRQHNRILDSFAPTFDPNDSTIKNLAKQRNSLVEFTNEDYGLTLELPQSWAASEQIGTPYFSTEAEDAYLWMKVTSLVPGDTVDAWVERSNKRFERVFAADYRQTPEVSEVLWNGIPARMVKLSYSLDTEIWWEEYEIYAVRGDYRYYTEFAYLADTDSEYDALLEDILDSMQVDFQAVESHFGEIRDETDMMDMTLKVLKTNRSYGYQLSVPKFWSTTAGSLDSDQVDFTFLGGTLSVMVVEDLDDPQSALEDMREQYLDSFEGDEDVVVLEDGYATYAEQSARRIVIEDNRNDDRVPSRDIAYLFEHNRHVYIVQGTYGLANATDFVIDQLNAAMDSFRWTD